MGSTPDMALNPSWRVELARKAILSEKPFTRVGKLLRQASEFMCSPLLPVAGKPAGRFDWGYPTNFPLSQSPLDAMSCPMQLTPLHSGMVQP